jgi:hypothetical protein
MRQTKWYIQGLEPCKKELSQSLTINVFVSLFVFVTSCALRTY